MKDFIETRMSQEGFASASEFFRNLVRQEQRRQAKLILDAKIQVALDSGPAEPMIPEDWAA